MAKDVAAQRRRAALAALAGVLDEAALLQELWLLGEALRGESVTDIIEYVDGLARRQMLDAATCKRLYGEFFKALRLPEQNLPADPWPAMQAARPAPAPARVMAAPLAQPPAQPSWVPPRAAPVGSAWAAAAAVDIVVPPAAPAPAAVARAPQPVYAPAPPPAAAPPAAPALASEPPVVFGAVVRSVVAEVARFHAEALDEIRADAMRVLAGSPAPAGLREQFARAWQRPAQSDWQLQGPSADLAELMRVLHQALEMAFGRVGADQILQRAMVDAETLPEARRFSPKRLLSAM